MSALGFGILVGSVPGAVFALMGFGRESPEKAWLAVILTFALGLGALLFVPPLFGGFLDFLIGFAALPLTVFFGRYAAIQQTLREREEERAGVLADAEKKAALQVLAKETCVKWLSELRSKFQFIAQGRLVDGPHTGPCALALDPHERTLRIFGYTANREFRVQLEANIPLSKIISLEVVRPMEMKKVKRTQAVGIVSTNQKSPIARGLVGGALLGPAGLVLGAASGASKDIKTQVKEHTVWDTIQAEGDPQLHIGTADPATPLFRIKPDGAGEAEEWLFRIKALQAQAA